MKRYVVEKDGELYVVRANFLPRDTIGVLPEDFAEEDEAFVKAKKVKDAFGEDYYEFKVNGKQKSAYRDEEKKKKKLENIKEKYLKDVYREMSDVFGTTATDTATADYETWKHMLDEPGRYKDLGITFDGVELNSELLIKQYAKSMIQKVYKYGVYRFKRKNQYKKEKEEAVLEEDGSLIDKIKI